jgi:hypothetical protein
LFKEKVPLKELFTFDHMYYKIKNAEAFINNGSIIVREISALSFTPEVLEMLSNNINMEMHPSPDQNVQGLMVHIRDESYIYKKKFEDTKIDTGTVYSDLIRAICNKSEISIYNIDENGNTFKE